MRCSSEAGPRIKIGMAQFRVGIAPMTMITMALGSCVGIVLYDEKAGLGGLAHVMHPNRDKVKNNLNRAKFVDTAIELMVAKILKEGARKERLWAKIFGGARMFQHVTGSQGVIQIGDANVAATREQLTKRGIPIVAESVGGTMGRTIMFDVSDGSVLMKDSLNNEEIF
ncbi:MAG: chemotaxis protein CheD [Candidatus Krumholzibacteria bacterium]|nr:chemotaxis protein CheD [Candidatus Krumholzibacteria bacterium]